MRFLPALILLLFVADAMPLYAQTHPCDTTPVSIPSVQVGQPFTLGWCQNPTLDLNGQPSPVTGYRVYRNGTLDSVTAVTDPTPNAAGLVYSHVQLTESIAAASVAFSVSAVNAQAEGAKSPFGPFAVTPVLGPPPVPVNLRISAP